MHERSPGGDWEYRERPGESGPHTDGDWFAGTVPGGLYTDLPELDLIPDRFYGNNELEVHRRPGLHGPRRGRGPVRRTRPRDADGSLL